MASSGDWTVETDPDTKRTFFHNEKTGVSQFHNPHQEQEPQRFVQAEFAKKRRSSVVKAINVEWQIHVDPTTGDIFYHNQTTEISSWTIPEGVSEVQKEEMEHAFEQATFSHKRRQSIVGPTLGDWEQHTDPVTQQVFFHNPTTGISAWEMPEESSFSSHTDAAAANIVEAGKLPFRLENAPEMIPVGFDKMVNDASNHRLVVPNVSPSSNGSDTRIVIIGSGFHVAVALVPTIAGVTPDIQGDFNKNDAQGKVTFASITACCASIEAATSVKIRKNKLDDEEKQAKGKPTVLAAVVRKKALQLQEYKTNVIVWLKSLAPTHVHATTCITFVRNVYPMDPNTGAYIEGKFFRFFKATSSFVGWTVLRH